MQYTKVTFEAPGEETREVLMALLADAGYDGFEETEKELLAYISSQEFNADELKGCVAALDISYDTEVVPAQNWNALWESNFQPVIVEDLCTIRAHFHDIEVKTPFDIVITPKMSFGTGHHATTQLMMLQMRHMEMTGRSVLDFGTGTGVLAILAEMMGAQKILAIDNDEWSVENAAENIVRNHCEKIIIEKGSLENVVLDKFDIILANINRHILLEQMPILYKKVKKEGCLLMSGLLAEDKDIIMEAATKAGFYFLKQTEQNNWISMLFKIN